ncbi:hypothetical protein VC83_07711 [Pseudogymnoascus destructans]|uniref:Uncharacterized protein n=1 Tax=Pseudogymnoascus destructans TaxID=655981 RepID=A0A177A084_9PEZI|nr:uncharacterized protein VC83_07711 [Pseudogymnoascus destructans]OAF55507.1 hypothetical protein VC83_07711 [Pseudogymnoascus destructans]
MDDDDDGKAKTSGLWQTSTSCQVLQQRTEKNALGRQSNGQGHTFGPRGALIGTPPTLAHTKALSVGGNKRFSPITTAIGFRVKDSLV